MESVVRRLSGYGSFGRLTGLSGEGVKSGVSIIEINVTNASTGLI
jgi:hypothetical protein